MTNFKNFVVFIIERFKFCLVYIPSTKSSPLWCCLSLIPGFTGESGLERASQVWRVRACGKGTLMTHLCVTWTPRARLSCGPDQLVPIASLEPSPDS